MTREVIVMIGFPGSGKSTYAKRIVEEANYYRVDGDVFKTPHAMVMDALQNAHDRSILFDSTGGTRKRRQVFLDFAKRHQLPIRAVWVTTPIEVALLRNEQRPNPVPPIALYSFRKHFEEPTLEEGFQSIETVTHSAKEKNPHP
jgi:bifunctional polynucleotide phosphatase/kinase